MTGRLKPNHDLCEPAHPLYTLDPAQETFKAITVILELKGLLLLLDASPVKRASMVLVSADVNRDDERRCVFV
jgi:hypothetical protein